MSSRMVMGTALAIMSLIFASERKSKEKGKTKFKRAPITRPESSHDEEESRRIERLYGHAHHP
jgi:hypothetical protein